MSGFDAAAALLPASLRGAARALSPGQRATVIEFRLRLGRIPGAALSRGKELPLGETPVMPGDLARVLELATGFSPYTAAASMSQGYLSAPGGVRVGLCGRIRPGTEGVWATTELSSVCIRIPREVRNCAAGFCDGNFVSTLILSPPGGGKTTFLRDMVRMLSDNGYRIGLCDERGEVAAFAREGFGFDVGVHTDVITDCPKHRSALMLLRTMDPDIIAMDEITQREDVAACRSAANCGVALLATAHAASREELERRSLYAELMGERIFRRLIWIRMTDGQRYYEEEWF